MKQKDLNKILSEIAANQIEMMEARERRNYNPEKKMRMKKAKNAPKREKRFNNNLLRMAIFDTELAETL